MSDDRWKDDEDDWPEPERDPEKLAKAHEEISRGNLGLQRKTLRYMYFGLAILVILVIVLAIMR